MYFISQISKTFRMLLSVFFCSPRASWYTSWSLTSASFASSSVFCLCLYITYVSLVAFLVMYSNILHTYLVKLNCLDIGCGFILHEICLIRLEINHSRKWHNNDAIDIMYLSGDSSSHEMYLSKYQDHTKRKGKSFYKSFYSICPYPMTFVI